MPTSTGRVATVVTACTMAFLSGIVPPAMFNTSGLPIASTAPVSNATADMKLLGAVLGGPRAGIACLDDEMQRARAESRASERSRRGRDIRCKCRDVTARTGVILRRRRAGHSAVQRRPVPVAVEAGAARDLK